MFNTNNPYQNTDVKAYYRNFYYQNKLLVYLMIASLIIQLIARSSFFDIIYYIYLIYFGGFILKQYLGEQRVLMTYIISGILGLISIPIFFGNNSGMLFLGFSAFAASASLGLLTAAATYVPNMEVQLMLFGRVKIKWIALVLVGMDIMSMLSPMGWIRAAHLGGIIYGFASIISMKQGGFQFSNPFENLFKRKGPYYKKNHYNSNTTSYKRAESDEDYNTRKNNEQAEIDNILEKIKKKGYETLSAEEKQKLFDKGNNG
jgi:membrane associated rhomboid family serine protease